MKRYLRTAACAGCAFLLLSVFAHAAVYLVDQRHPLASDANAGTPDAPWKTVSRAASAAKAGDTVYVAEGVYDERVSISSSGTSGKRICFLGVPPRAAVVRGFVITGAWVRVSGFHITSETPTVGSSAYDGGFLIDGEYVEVSDNLVTNLNAAVSGKGKHVVVRHNRFSKCQISVVVGGEHWLFDGNEIHRVFQHIPDSDCDYMRLWGKNHVVRCNRFHGTKKSSDPAENEVGKAHLDILQTWATKEYHFLQDLLCEKNFCEVFSQGAMVECDLPGHVARLVFQENIYWKGGSWGLNINGAQDVTVRNNTFVAIGLFGPVLRKGSTGVVEDNLCVDIGTRQPTRWYDRQGEKVGITDAFFVDSSAGNFRLRKESPCVAAGRNGGAVGACGWPQVYYVDGSHPAADDAGPGYPGWPLRTIRAALSRATEGETVVVRGGVYRENIMPALSLSRDRRICLRSWEAETAVVSPAREVTGWRRDGQRWVASYPERPTTLHRDGRPAQFEYDSVKKLVAVKGFDPRLCLMEAFGNSKSPLLTISGADVR